MRNNSDFNDLVSALSDAGVRFLIVGAYAVAHHSEPRYTKDLDIWVEPAKANARRVMTALEAFGAPLSQISAKDFWTPGIIFQIGVEPVRVDLLTSIAGLDFGAAYEAGSVGSFGGRRVRFLSLDDTLTAKRAAGRPTDLIDVERLEEARREQTATSVRLSAAPCQKGSVVIATISWPRGRAADGGVIRSDTLVSALEGLQRRCDLVLCAGMSVEDWPAPSAIIEASLGAPVLFERDDGRYCIVYEEQGRAVRRILRTKQEVARRKQFFEEHAGDNPVAAAISRGEGLIYIEALDLWLVVLICGESNAISYGSGTSVFRNKPAHLALPGAFQGRWILLNPAHRPFRQGLRTGFTKVGVYAGRGPTLGKLVRHRRAYADGTVAPAAVVHCNNFHDGETSDSRGARRYASTIFWGGRRRLPKRELGDTSVRRVVYELPLGDLP